DSEIQSVVMRVPHEVIDCAWNDQQFVVGDRRRVERYRGRVLGCRYERAVNERDSRGGQIRQAIASPANGVRVYAGSGFRITDHADCSLRLQVESGDDRITRDYVEDLKGLACRCVGQR